MESFVEGAAVVVESSDRYDEICIVITRCEARTGMYSVKIEQGE